MSKYQHWNAFGGWRTRIGRYSRQRHQGVGLGVISRYATARNVVAHQLEAIHTAFLKIIPYRVKIDPIAFFHAQRLDILGVDENHLALSKNTTVAVIIAVNRGVVLVV